MPTLIREIVCLDGSSSDEDDDCGPPPRFCRPVRSYVRRRPWPTQRLLQKAADPIDVKEVVRTTPRAAEKKVHLETPSTAEDSLPCEEKPSRQQDLETESEVESDDDDEEEVWSWSSDDDEAPAHKRQSFANEQLGAHQLPPDGSIAHREGPHWKRPIAGDPTPSKAARKEGRWTADGCMLPKHQVVEKEASGLWKRPPGRQPRGFVWDGRRGCWAPLRLYKAEKEVHLETPSTTECSPHSLLCAEKPSRHRDPETESDDDEEEVWNSTSDNDETPVLKRPRKGDRFANLQLALGAHQLPDGSIVPAHRERQGSHWKRPIAGEPNAYVWDKERGLWMYTPERAMTPSKAALEAARKEGRWTADGCMLPKHQVVEKEASGLWKRPPGRQPRGFVWDGRRGCWAPLRLHK